MTIAEKIAGTWVRDCDMDPRTNIAGRRWWARGNREGVGMAPMDVDRTDLWWHFPTQEESKDG